jgi:hypothetical protein
MGKAADKPRSIRRILPLVPAYIYVHDQEGGAEAGAARRPSGQPDQKATLLLGHSRDIVTEAEEQRGKQLVSQPLDATIKDVSPYLHRGAIETRL